MTNETLAEILTGQANPSDRADLHRDLDALLDAADEDGGPLDGPAFWSFVANMARGRGIADEIAAAANKHVAKAGIPDNPAGAAKTVQWAILSAVLRRVTAFPGELVPKEFRASAFMAAADNIVTGNGEMGRGEHFDVLGLGTQRGSPDQAERRAAKRLLVSAVWLRAALNGGSDHEIGKARRELLRDQVSGDTFKGWVREVMKARRMTREELWAEVMDAARTPFPQRTFDEAKIEDLLKTAHWPR